MDDLNFYPCTCGYQVRARLITINRSSSKRCNFLCRRFADSAGTVYVLMKMGCVPRVGKRIRKTQPTLHRFPKSRYVFLTFLYNLKFVRSFATYFN